MGTENKSRDKFSINGLFMSEEDFLRQVNEIKEKSKELQKTDNDDKFVTLRVPLKIAAPGWGENFKKPVFPHVNIPKADVMDTSAVKPLGELIGCKLDEEMIAFGKEHGFPVIFVICERTSKEHDGVFTNERRIQFFENNQMHYAAEFAKNNNGELGVYDPRCAEKKFNDE